MISRDFFHYIPRIFFLFFSPLIFVTILGPAKQSPDQKKPLGRRRKGKEEETPKRGLLYSVRSKEPILVWVGGEREREGRSLKDALVKVSPIFIPRNPLWHAGHHVRHNQNDTFQLCTAMVDTRSICANWNLRNNTCRVSILSPHAIMFLMYKTIIAFGRRFEFLFLLRLAAKLGEGEKEEDARGRRRLVVRVL